MISMKEKDFKIRKLKNIKKDRDILLCFDNKLGDYEKTLEPGLIKTERIIYNNIPKVLSDRNCLVLVLEEKDVPIGYIVGKLKKFPKCWKDKKYGYIECIYIEPKFRGKNLGFTLFSKVKEWFNKNGCKSIRLRVFANNQSAISKYKKWGFKNNIIIMSSLN